MELKLVDLENININKPTSEKKFIQQIFCIKKDGNLKFFQLGNPICIPEKIIEILNDTNFEITLVDKILQNIYMIHMKNVSNIEEIHNKLINNDTITFLDTDFEKNIITFELKV